MTALTREIFELLQQIEIRLGQCPRRDPLQQRHPRTLGRLGTAPILAGQKTARQWKIGQYPDAEMAAGGNQLALDMAL